IFAMMSLPVFALPLSSNTRDAGTVTGTPFTSPPASFPASRTPSMIPREFVVSRSTTSTAILIGGGGVGRGVSGAGVLGWGVLADLVGVGDGVSPGDSLACALGFPLA